MANDDPIEPINLDAPSRVLPVEPTTVARPNPVTPAPTTGPAPPTEGLANALERSLLLEGDGIRNEPAGIEQRAELHDAVLQGDAYALAVEEARIQRDEQTIDPNSIGQVLGGAAAAAYSGQTTQIDRSSGGSSSADERTEQAEDPTRELDRLAPAPRVSDDDEDDRRRREYEQALRDGNLDEM